MTRYIGQIFSITPGNLFDPTEVVPELMESPSRILRKKKGKMPSCQNYRKHLNKLYQDYGLFKVPTTAKWVKAHA